MVRTIARLSLLLATLIGASTALAGENLPDAPYLYGLGQGASGAREFDEAVPSWGESLVAPGTGGDDGSPLSGHCSETRVDSTEEARTRLITSLENQVVQSLLSKVGKHSTTDATTAQVAIGLPYVYQSQDGPIYYVPASGWMEQHSTWSGTSSVQASLAVKVDRYAAVLLGYRD